MEAVTVMGEARMFWLDSATWRERAVAVRGGAGAVRGGAGASCSTSRPARRVLLSLPLRSSSPGNSNGLAGGR